MRKALVTGASSGIGLITAQELAKNGYHVTSVARSIDKLNAQVLEYAGEGHQALRADLASPEGLQSLSEHLESSSYDVLINNAGFGLYGRFHEIPLPKQEMMMTLNMNALVALSYAYLKGAKHGDALINIASVLGFSSFPGGAVYSGTKGFVIRFTESLWYEYKDLGIYVGTVCPGATKTPFHDVAGGSDDNIPEMMTQTPEQVAAVVLATLKARKKPVVTSGGLNKAMVFSGRLTSRKQMVNIMGGFSPTEL